jgi:hypothetical protein
MANHHNVKNGTKMLKITLNILKRKSPAHVGPPLSEPRGEKLGYVAKKETEC